MYILLILKEIRSVDESMDGDPNDNPSDRYAKLI